MFDPDHYGDRGKIMDGWETRRRREPGHDHAVIRLATKGIVRAVVVDTSFFTGNYPHFALIEGASLPPYASPAEVLADDVEWVTLLEKSALKGNTKNPFEISASYAVTHLRLRIFPDGGVARLRVYGEPHVAWSRLGPQPNLVAAMHGGRNLRVSDEHYGVRDNLLMPGLATDMRDGWEVRRRRDDGNDWCVLKLGVAGTIRRAEIDTRNFKGNCPGSCRLEVATWGGPLPDDLQAMPWREILPKFRLQPHTRHLVTELADVGAGTHVRLSIYPDGGVSRLQLHGDPDDDALFDQGVRRAGATLPRAKTKALTDCCGSSRWVAAMAGASFSTAAELFAASDAAWATCGPDDWKEAFSHHPRIGERRVVAQSDAAAKWSAGEQAAAQAGEAEVRARIAALNVTYEERFGMTYIVCATGKSAAEILANLEGRLGNAHDAELAVAAGEQHQITRIRLEKWVRAQL